MLQDWVIWSQQRALRFSDGGMCPDLCVFLREICHNSPLKVILCFWKALQSTVLSQGTCLHCSHCLLSCLKGNLFPISFFVTTQIYCNMVFGEWPGPAAWNAWLLKNIFCESSCEILGYVWTQSRFQSWLPDYRVDLYVWQMKTTVKYYILIR